ncbi:MAG TPA: ABC transporter permease [Streptosporangiaceae bacterium]|jgi:hypothetical protein
MIRLAWRQFRVQALVAGAALVVVAVVLAVTGPRFAHDYVAAQAACNSGGDCTSIMAQFVGDYHAVQVALDVLVLALPALIGIFWGAPLVARELETGTFRMAWTQSVTRNRWMIVKLAVAGLSGLIVAGLFSLMVTWWSSRVDQVNLNRLTPAMFGERGLVPVGYTALAFAIGVLAGLLIRRTVPAMAVTLIAFVGARLAMTYGLRPRLFRPLTIVVSSRSLAGTGGGMYVTPGGADWVLTDQTLNRTGQVIGQNGGIGPNGGLGFHYAGGVLSLLGVGPCPGHLAPAAVALSGPGGRAGRGAFQRVTQACLAHYDIHQVVTYQPISRYWPLQWSELGIFLAVAVLACALCVWRVRKHA